MDKCVSHSSAISWALLLLLVCLVQLQWDGFCFSLFGCCLLETSCFLIRDRKGVDPLEGEVGKDWEIEEGKL